MIRRALVCCCPLLAAACRDDVVRSAHGAAGHSSARVNIYAAAGPNALAPAAARARPLVYVPNSLGASVTVIDPSTHAAIRTFHTGSVPQHVVPSYDLKTLWVTNNKANTLTPINPITGREGKSIHVDDPYNMYFTPDGRFAVVVAEQRRRLDFLDARDMKLVHSLPVDCQGLDHMDFTADNKFAIATCEFSAEIVKVELDSEKVVSHLELHRGWFRRSGMPQDIRSSPDGRVFFVADMKADGVFLVDPAALKQIGFLETGKGRTDSSRVVTVGCCMRRTAAGTPPLEVAMVPAASA